MAEDDSASGLVTRTPIMVGVLQLTLTEGDTSQTFYIAKTLLDQKAPGFLETVDPGSDHATTIELANINITTFKLFVEWLDSKTSGCREVPNSCPLHVAYKHYSWCNLMPIVEVYGFGNEYAISSLREDALYQLSLYMTEHLRQIGRSRLLMHRINRNMALDLIEYVYNHLDPNSPLRQFFVDTFCASNMKAHVSAYMLMNYPKEFLVDVMVQKARLVEYVGSFAQAVQRLEDWQHYGEKTAKARWMMLD